MATRAQIESQPQTGAAAPILIGGMNRSGTTLMARMLGSHSAVAVLPTELRFFSPEFGGRLEPPSRRGALGRLPYGRLPLRLGAGHVVGRLHARLRG